MTKVFLIVFAFSFNQLYSQDILKTGLIRVPIEEIEKTRLIGASLNGLSKEDVAKKSIDLSEFIPIIEDQGISESCAAFSVASAITILINEKNKKTFDRDKLVFPKSCYDFCFSPSYIYNLSKQKYPDGVKSDCAFGISYIDALNTVMNYGVVSWNTFPYKSTLCDCDNNPTEELNGDVVQSSTKIYIYEPINVNSKLFVRILSQDFSNPICIGANLDKNYIDAGHHINNNQWNAKGEALTQTNSYHAMVIVGFDNDKKLFKVLDSRGSGWGDKGFIYISYDLIDNPNKIVDVAYLPLLDNKLLGEEKVSTNGTANPSNGANEILKWALKVNRYSVIDNIRIILVSIDRNNGIFNFQFKDDNTGEIIGSQLTYPFKKDSAKEILIKDHSISIQPTKLNRRDMLTFYLTVQKK